MHWPLACLKQTSLGYVWKIKIFIILYVFVVKCPVQPTDLSEYDITVLHDRLIMSSLAICDVVRPYISIDMAKKNSLR